MCEDLKLRDLDNTHRENYKTDPTYIGIDSKGEANITSQHAVKNGVTYEQRRALTGQMILTVSSSYGRTKSLFPSRSSSPPFAMLPDETARASTETRRIARSASARLPQPSSSTQEYEYAQSTSLVACKGHDRLTSDQFSSRLVIMKAENIRDCLQGRVYIWLILYSLKTWICPVPPGCFGIGFDRGVQLA